MKEIAEDKYEQSARYFKALHTQFRKLGYQLAQRKKKSPIRVLEAVLFEPLESVELIGKEEQELLAICHQVMYHKNRIVEYAIKERENKPSTKGENNE